MQHKTQHTRVKHKNKKRSLNIANMMPTNSTMFLLSSLALLFMSAAAAVRVVSEEELADKVGQEYGDSELWMSIMGEVYDVTTGGTFYGKNESYSIFAGRDASVPFITGVFTPEEALKGLDVLDPDQLYSLDTWRKFYEDVEQYPFVGLLEGRLYDKDGNPTEELTAVRVLIAETKLEIDQSTNSTLRSVSIHGENTQVYATSTLVYTGEDATSTGVVTSTGVTDIVCL
jgi:hypothetical protein